MHVHTHQLVEMDKHRLCYLAYTLQQDMELQAKHTAMAHSSPARSPITHTPLPSLPNLESLLEQREREMEQCNMLLLLLLACLEYSLPVDVMRATLETAKLTTIGYIHVLVHCTSFISNMNKLSKDDYNFNQNFAQKPKHSRMNLFMIKPLMLLA